MSSTHDTSAEEVTAYLDAELGAEESAAFEARLADDPQVRSEVEELRAMLSLVGTLPDVVAPPDFCEKVAKRIRKRQRFGLDSAAWTLVSLTLQVLSIIVILTVAALYMMAELDRTPTSIERESIRSANPANAADGSLGPRPIEP